MILPLELAESVSASSFLAHETTVKLRRDIRITCKIFFILSSKSQEFISNLKSRLFIFWNQTLWVGNTELWICTRDCLFNSLYSGNIIDLCLPFVNTYTLLLKRCNLQEIGGFTWREFVRVINIYTLQGNHYWGWC